MKTIKIIFLFVLILCAGFAFGQSYDETEENSLTLRDDDLPYDATLDSVGTLNDEFADLTNNENVEPNDESIEPPSPAVYFGRAYYFDTWNHLGYMYYFRTDKPNVVIVYYGNGYNFTYYPYATAMIYPSWGYWPLYRYSSWGNFCRRHPSFHRDINRHCTAINFSGNNYGRPMAIRDYYYGKRGNYGGSSNNQGRQRSDNNGYRSTGRYKNSQQTNQPPTSTISREPKRTTGNTVVWKNGNRQNGSNDNFTGTRSKQYSTGQTKTNFTPATRSESNPSKRYNSNNSGNYATPTPTRSRSNNNNNNDSHSAPVARGTSYTLPTRSGNSGGGTYSTPTRSGSSGSNGNGSARRR